MATSAWNDHAAAAAPGPRQAVVTGTSSGIGRAIAERLLGDGWQVAGLDLAPPAIEAAGFQALTVDLRDAGATEAALQQVQDRRGGQGTPNVRDTLALVHAAGVLRTGALGGSRAEDVQRDAQLMWQLHIDAPSRLAAALLPGLRAAGHGRIVLVGSRVARGIAGRSQYAATKAAMVALARSWAAELVAEGITANVVSPAATRTAMLHDPARQATTPKLPPIGRLIEPAEIASLAAFLLSPEAAAITGQDIQVCGGASLER